MKKLIAFAAAGALALTLTGCAQKTEPIEQGDPPSAESQKNTNELKDLEITESGFYVDEFGYAHYAAIVANENMDRGAQMVNVKVTSKDADGKILGSSDAYLTALFANGKTAVCGSTIDGKSPASVEFQVVPASNMWQDGTTQQAEFDKAFFVQNVNETVDDFGYTTVAGEIENTGTGGFSGTTVNAVFRAADGTIVGGAMTSISSVPAGTTVPFSIDYIQNVPEHATVDVFVDCGFPGQS